MHMGIKVLNLFILELHLFLTIIAKLLNYNEESIIKLLLIMNYREKMLIDKWIILKYALIKTEFLDSPQRSCGVN